MEVIRKTFDTIEGPVEGICVKWEGFSKDNADIITGDSIRHEVKWRGKSDLSKLKGKAIALKFYMERCKLYSFVFGKD